MIDPTTFILFLVASMLIALAPGPDMLYILTRSVSQGRSAGVVSALGVHTGVLIHTLIAALGLSALIAASALAFSVVKYLGAAYLIYLGIRTLFTKEDNLTVADTPPVKLRRAYLQGIVTNLLNPKIILFFLAYLPQFLDVQGNTVTQTLLLGVLFVVFTLPVDVGVAFLGGWARGWLGRNAWFGRVKERVMGGVFITLGLTTAFGGSED